MRVHACELSVCLFKLIFFAFSVVCVYVCVRGGNFPEQNEYSPVLPQCIITAVQILHPPVPTQCSITAVHILHPPVLTQCIITARDGSYGVFV